jgi:hypothetical protein
MWFRPILLAVALGLAAPAFADEPAATPTPSASLDPKERATLDGFGAAHPECREWSDGCSVCNLLPRDEATKTDNADKHVQLYACSLPGIACQPNDIVCKAP